MSKKANEFFEKFKGGLVGGLNTIAIGKIVRFDPVKMAADVVILPENNLILDVPVGAIQTNDFYIRVPYKKGDPVLVSFAQRDIDEIMRGGQATTTERMLSLDDAIVVCGLNVYTNSLPAADSDKLVIGEKNGPAKITIGGGRINLIGNVMVNGMQIGPGGGSS